MERKDSYQPSQLTFLQTGVDFSVRFALLHSPSVNEPHEISESSLPIEHDPQLANFAQWFPTRFPDSDWGVNNTVVVRGGYAVRMVQGSWTQPTPYLKIGKNVPFVIILLPSASEEFLPELVKAEQILAEKLAKNSGQLFIVEEHKGKLSPEERKARINIVKKTGLAEAKVFTPHEPDIVVWTARRKKERQGISFLNKLNVWKFTILPTLQLLKKIGYEVVLQPKNTKTSDILSWQNLLDLAISFVSRQEQGIAELVQILENYELPPILKYLADCKNYPQARDMFVQAYGLTLRKLNCSCSVHMDMRGDPHTAPCNTCNGEFPSLEPMKLHHKEGVQANGKFQLYKDLPTQITCADCGQLMHVQIVTPVDLTDILPYAMIPLQREVFCQCGAHLEPVYIGKFPVSQTVR